MKKINLELINPVKKLSQDSIRRRAILNFHTDYNDLINRMINVMQPDTYSAPHKHENPDKREVFILLQGKVVVCEFDNSGNIKDHIVLSTELGSYGVEILPSIWHNVICLQADSVLYEIKDGPYDSKTDKIFANWAPKEGDEDCNEYNKKILKQLSLNY